jgi:hypothetical protein
VTFTCDRLGWRLTAVRGSTTSTFSYTTASLPLGESHAGGTLGGWRWRTPVNRRLLFICKLWFPPNHEAAELNSSYPAKGNRVVNSQN